MRVFITMTAVMLTIALGGTSWSAPPTSASAPGPIQAPPVSGDLAQDVAAPGQGCEGGQPCEGEGEPGVLGSVFGRFLCPGECDPHWSFSGDAVALQRSSARSQPLFSSGTTELVNSRHLEFPVALGFQLDAIRRGPCGWEWELGYFQIDNFDASSTVAGDSFMTTSSDGTGQFVSNAEARYRSAIHLAEINLRRQWCEGFTVLVGFRTGELDEIYSAGGLGTRLQAPINLDIKTFNHLYGLQTGAIYEFYNIGGPLRVSATCKAGMYGNSAIQSSHLAETGDSLLEAHRNQATFMGEAGALANYDVTCHLSLRAFCQAMWIEGVALAPEQIGANDFTTLAAGIDTHGGVFYYGGGLGAELKF